MRRVDIATQVENLSLVTSQRTLVNLAIQVALDRVCSYFDWPYYLQSGYIRTTAPYTTGTVSITNGNKTVTGSSTVWTSDMAGRKIRFNDQNTFYHIASVNTSTQVITLQEFFSGTTDTDATYSIYKDEYRLPSDLDKQKSGQQLFNAIYLRDLSPGEFDQAFPSPRNEADPVFQVLVGTKLDTYSTGTVTVSGSTVTGSGTSWTSVEGLGRMNNITIGTGTGTQVATIKSVDSDTQITTYENLNSVSAGVAYFATLNNLVLQLYQIPDAARIIAFRYYRQPQYLANDFDIPDMPHRWHWLLIYGALSMVMLHKGDKVGQPAAEAQFMAGLEQMKLKIGSFVSNRISKRKSVDRQSRITSDGIERAAYDRRYSS